MVCEGTITVLRAQDIFVPPLNDCEISCTIKLDVDMLVSPQLTSAVCHCAVRTYFHHFTIIECNFLSILQRTPHHLHLLVSALPKDGVARL